ncbi:unnamed protein product [Brassica oleracea var. botrytis]|uniref:Uncharacterized protein n=2 Tax=Brassica TaxID=3705 RepID=A0A0D3A219_BRAOL|nr:hypothetical protein HID58_040335 [Brassica napus]CAF2067935.1 unnamed protein product [Brassica napus]
MRSATWCIFFCFLIFLVISDGKRHKEEVEPDKFCTRFEDIEGNCKVGGPKACAKYMSTNPNSKINYFNCTCDNIYMLRKIKRYCLCQSLCRDHPPPSPIQPR